MGVYLIGMAMEDLASISFWWNIIQAALGLGAVIFVHELGHFAVAKLCGVKCEKFYLGFDIKGIKLFHYQWGETEYGIGILPLGGYVKMLGQDDNPGKAHEEHERSKLQTGDLPLPVEEDETGQNVPLDPRSYLAQTVPERMAIISAGVIMNVIFAFVVLVVAFKLGVREQPAIVSMVVPGEAAWKAGLRPGDEIVEIAGIKKPRYDDVRQAVSLGDIENGVPLLVRRLGEKELLSLNVMPVKKGLAPRIGIISSMTTTLGDKEPAGDDCPAKDKFRGGDRIVAVDGEELGDDDDAYSRWQAALVRHPDKTLDLVVARIPAELAAAGKVVSQVPGGRKSVPTEDVTVALPPLPTRHVGLVVALGAITAVQPDSPAQSAGLKVGDRITEIDGQPPVDPMFLQEWVRRRAGQTLKISVERAGESQPVELTVEPREVNYSEPANEVVGVPGLGIAVAVLNTVAEVTGNAPDDLKPGDELVGAQFILPKEGVDKRQRELFERLNKELSEVPFHWPVCFNLIQSSPSGTKLELRLQGGRSATLDIVNADDWNQYDRGLNFTPLFHIRRAESAGEAASLAWSRTKEYLLMVYRFIRKLASGQVSGKGLGGPWTILQAAYYTAESGFAEFLTFLAMLSANLAVVNFLPIPVLDGGHMVFLTYEAIRRKPPSEKIVIALSYLGLFLILTLMVWVLALDFGIISRR